MPTRRPRQAPFVQVFKEPMKGLGHDVSLTASVWRTIATLIGACGYGGHIALSQRELAVHVCVSPGQMSRIMAELVSRGVVLRDPPLHGRQWQYRLSTIYGHMGDTAELGWRRARDIDHSHSQGQPPTMTPNESDDVFLPRKRRSASSRRVSSPSSKKTC